MSTELTAKNSDIRAADDVVHDAAVRAMSARGIDNPEDLLGFAEPQAILRACRWFDGLSGVGPGVLAKTIREGGRPESKSMAQRQQAYGEEIVTWLRKNFPQWNRPDGNRTHTAAIAEVIRLHHRHGKGQLTKREHGPAIRAAVKKWEQTFKQEPEREE